MKSILYNFDEKVIYNIKVYIMKKISYYFREKKQSFLYINIPGASYIYYRTLTFNMSLLHPYGL